MVDKMIPLITKTRRLVSCFVGRQMIKYSFREVLMVSAGDNLQHSLMVPAGWVWWCRWTNLRWWTSQLSTCGTRSTDPRSASAATHNTYSQRETSAENTNKSFLPFSPSLHRSSPSPHRPGRTAGLSSPPPSPPPPPRPCCTPPWSPRWRSGWSCEGPSPSAAAAPPLSCPAPRAPRSQSPSPGLGSGCGRTWRQSGPEDTSSALIS